MNAHPRNSGEQDSDEGGGRPPGAVNGSVTGSVNATANESGPPDFRELGIRELSRYRLIIDARSPREYEDDHLPGAANLPVVDNDQYAEVGTTHRNDTHRAYVIGVAHSLRNMAEAIETRIGLLPPDARILVYCFRGGKRSRLWADALKTIGFRIDVLPGGWKKYRGWVRDHLERWPTRFDYRVLNGPTGCGKTRLLQALQAQGAQVLDLEGLARHRGSLIGALPGIEQPGQKWFDSLLLERMRGFDPRRPVWIEAESKRIGQIQLPESLHRTMHASPRCYQLEAPMAERVRLWREDFGHFESDPIGFIERLQHLVPLVGHQEFKLWQELAHEGRMPELFERLMTHHYDPAYARSSRRNYGDREMRPVTMADLSPAALEEVARELIGQG